MSLISSGVSLFKLLNSLRSLVSKSSGVKRYIASILSMLIAVVALNPETANIVPILQDVAGVFGVTGMLHAVTVGTTLKAKLASLASLLAFIISLAQFVPQLQPYVPLLQQLAAILAAASVGSLATAKLSTAAE